MQHSPPHPHLQQQQQQQQSAVSFSEHLKLAVCFLPRCLSLELLVYFKPLTCHTFHCAAVD